MSTEPQTRYAYEFGAFRLDPAERLLLRNGQAISLTPKAFDLLVYLVEHRGRLVDKQTLMSALWPDTIVEETNLTYTVSMLRKVLDEEDGASSMIQTVPTRGYRFVAPVTEVPVAAKVPAGRRQLRMRPALAAGLGVAIGLTAWFMITWPGSSTQRPSESTDKPAETSNPSPPRVVPLTTLTGLEEYPAFSPNGEEVVFAWPASPTDDPFTIPIDRGKGTTQNLYITLVGSTDVRRLTEAAATDGSPAYSPDGRQIAFLRSAAGTVRIYVVSVVGGAAVKVSNFPATDGLAWSPDGSYLVAGHYAENSGLFAIPLDGGEPRVITQAKLPAHHLYPAVAPDGHRLAYVACRRSEPQFFDCDVQVVSVDDRLAPTSMPRRLTTMPLIQSLAWTRDGHAVVFAGDEVGSQRTYLWRADAAGQRAPTRIEAAGMDVGGVAVARTRNRLAFARYVFDDDVFRFSGGYSEPLISSSATDDFPSYSNDGRSISFCSDRSGTIEVWVADADGSSPRQLTRGPNPQQCGGGMWSPDDSQIAFDSQSRDGKWHIWTIAVEGSTPRQLTFGPIDQNLPFWSRDGEWIYFAADHGRAIARVRATGGPPEDVTSGGSGLVGRESVDGKVLFYQPTRDDSPLLALTLADRRTTQVLPCVQAGAFAVVRHGIYYIPCRSGKNAPVHVLDPVLRRNRLFGSLPQYLAYAGWALAVSPDGMEIAYTRTVDRRADLMLLEDFR